MFVPFVQRPLAERLKGSFSIVTVYNHGSFSRRQTTLPAHSPLGFQLDEAFASAIAVFHYAVITKQICCLNAKNRSR